MLRKFLVAVDGSVYSNNTLRYLGRLFADLDEIHCHLLCIVPCTVSATGREWLDELDLLSTLSAESRKKFTAAKRYMNEAVLQFGRRGISPNQVTTQVLISRMDIASDIVLEARKGLYDALIIGRRGLGKLEEMVMGSTSSRVMEKCSDVPIWIVDGQVNSRRFLVPVDGSFHTLKAVDHLAFVLKNNPYAEITLFHSAAMFGQMRSVDMDQCRELLGPRCNDELLADPESHFLIPERILLDSGFSPDKILRRTTTKGLYPSRQIVRQALMEEHGTIVMGRRTEDVKKGLFGSVSDQVIAMAEDIAIWIVS